MRNSPYLWTLVVGLGSLVGALWSPLLAWVPIILRELYFIRLLTQLRKLEVKHIPDLSPKANELLGRHPGYYWQPAAGRMYRQAVSLAGMLGVLLGIIGAVKGSWLCLGIGVANLAVMMVVAPRFDPSEYLSPEYAVAHDELVSYLIQSAREQTELGERAPQVKEQRDTRRRR